MQTTVVSVRVPVEDAKRFQEQAARFGLTRSTAGAALISSALAVEDAHAEAPSGKEQR